MIDRSDIEDALRTWVNTAVPPLTDVIFADQVGPRPTSPYATVKILSLARVGHDGHFNLNAITGIEDIHGNRVVGASVQFFGVGALEYAETARTALEKTTTQDILRAAGLVVYPPTDITVLTALRENDFEERAVFDARFGIGSLETDNVGVIENAEGSGDIVEPDDVTVADTITFLVPEP